MSITIVRNFASHTNIRISRKQNLNPKEKTKQSNTHTPCEANVVGISTSAKGLCVQEKTINLIDSIAIEPAPRYVSNNVNVLPSEANISSSVLPSETNIRCIANVLSTQKEDVNAQSKDVPMESKDEKKKEAHSIEPVILISQVPCDSKVDNKHNNSYGLRTEETCGTSPNKIEIIIDTKTNLGITVATHRIGWYEDYPPDSGKVGKRFVDAPFGELQNGEIFEMGHVLGFFCPYEDCKGIMSVQRDWINCRIFRHGFYLSNSQPINPHAPKSECDSLLEQKLIVGCARPLKYIPTNPENNQQEHIVSCGYE